MVSETPRRIITGTTRAAGAAAVLGVPGVLTTVVEGAGAAGAGNPVDTKMMILGSVGVVVGSVVRAGSVGARVAVAAAKMTHPVLHGVQDDQVPIQAVHQVSLLLHAAAVVVTVTEVSREKSTPVGLGPVPGAERPGTTVLPQKKYGSPRWR